MHFNESGSEPDEQIEEEVERAASQSASSALWANAHMHWQDESEASTPRARIGKVRGTVGLLSTLATIAVAMSDEGEDEGDNEGQEEDEGHFEDEGDNDDEDEDGDNDWAEDDDEGWEAEESDVRQKRRSKMKLRQRKESKAEQISTRQRNPQRSQPRQGEMKNEGGRPRTNPANASRWASYEQRKRHGGKRRELKQTPAAVNRRAKRKLDKALGPEDSRLFRKRLRDAENARRMVENQKQLLQLMHAGGKNSEHYGSVAPLIAQGVDNDFLTENLGLTKNQASKIKRTAKAEAARVSSLVTSRQRKTKRIKVSKEERKLTADFFKSLCYTPSGSSTETYKLPMRMQDAYEAYWVRGYVDVVLRLIVQLRSEDPKWGPQRRNRLELDMEAIEAGNFTVAELAVKKRQEERIKVCMCLVLSHVFARHVVQKLGQAKTRAIRPS
jgi:hypothetical protein